MSLIMGGEEIRGKFAELRQNLESTERKLTELNQKLERQDRRLDVLRKELLEDAKVNALIGERTYELFHPDPELIRELPGKLFNRDKACSNNAFTELTKHAKGDAIDDALWQKLLAEALVEAAAVPGAAQVFERQAFIKDYLAGLAQKYRAKYGAGWINLDDALFLYWLVRQTKPKRIVQCGAHNGLSSAFMMLALAKNGAEGRLHVVDQPAIFDSQAEEWRMEGRIFSAVVPEGKSSAWMVPDLYRDRLEVATGDVPALLAKALDGSDGVDLFYYASDHSYRAMKSAFTLAKPNLRPGALVVAVDVGWNASLWDFAQGAGVPSYTFKSAVGVAFF